MVKHLYIIIFFSSIQFFSIVVSAQVEKVFVEIYYISDADDATNVNGGILGEGSKTYRVFVDLLPGYKLRKLYGDKNHPLIFSSTAPIFNHQDDGVSFAYTLNKNRYFDNTTALDTWLTIGQTSRSGNDVVFGVPKIDDTNGSFIGGVNNDGGSAEIATGLLKSTNIASGVPLIMADGMMTSQNKPAEWLNQGFIDILTGEDFTIFGTSQNGITFKSYDAFLGNSGTVGVIPESNQILLAQITTQGELSFKLNLEIEDLSGNINKYVATDSALLVGEILLPSLNYPPVCGCQDPNYVEFDVNFSCNDINKCLNLIVFGCMDSNACNYNFNANINIEALCCYIGFCNDENIEIVCPELPNRNKDVFVISIAPNPVSNIIKIYHNINANANQVLEVIDIYGSTVRKEIIINDFVQEFDFSNLPNGLYFMKVSDSLQTFLTKLVKI